MSMNIFEAIREDHDKQRTMLDILTKTHGDSEGRAELFERVKHELRNHAKVEERAFYKPLIDKDMTQPKTRHSMHEHEQIDELLDELEKTDFSSPGWVQKARKLKQTVNHHLDEEEHKIFQLAGKVLTDDQKEDLARRYQRARAAES